MTTRNCTTNVSFGPQRWLAPGSNGETYTVTREHDGFWTCTCAYFEKRIRHPVPAVKYGCKHMRNADNGEYGKPHVRCSHRPAATLPAFTRARTSEAGRDLAMQLDV